MKIITRADFHSMKKCFGGDFWNSWKLYSTVFDQSDVDALVVPELATGLWADVKVCADGRWVVRRFFA